MPDYCNIIRCVIEYTHTSRNPLAKGVKINKMSVTRIGEVQAKPEPTEALRDFLISIMPTIKSSQGCESVALYQSNDDQTKFTMIEVWDSVESHQISAKNIPPDLLAEIRPLLVSAPSGRYYRLVE